MLVAVVVRRSGRGRGDRMKKNQVPRIRRRAAISQPIHTSVRIARSLLRSEGMRMPECLPRIE